MNFEKVSELDGRIRTCIEELDNIADELCFNEGIDSTELNKISDTLLEFEKTIHEKLKGYPFNTKEYKEQFEKSLIDNKII